MRTFGHYILSLLSLFSWALWLGGLVALVTFVMTLFVHHRPIAPEAATACFSAFEIFQLIVIPVAILSTLFWFAMARSLAKLVLLILLSIGGLTALIEATFVSPKIRDMYEKGTTQTDEFKQIHARSQTLYNTQAACLLLAGFAMAASIKSKLPPLPTATPQTPPPTGTPPSAAPGSDSPA